MRRVARDISSLPAEPWRFAPEVLRLANLSVASAPGSVLPVGRSGETETPSRIDGKLVSYPAVWVIGRIWLWANT